MPEDNLAERLATEPIPKDVHPENARTVMAIHVDLRAKDFIKGTFFGKYAEINKTETII